MGRLDVRVCEARNLPDPQVFGMPDPYVKVKLENQKHKTSVINNSTNPKWEEVFKFTVADENSSQLKLELWNSNVVKDDFLGEYVLSLSGLQRGVVRDEWFLLKQCKTNSEIRVRILAVDFGQLPPAGTVQVQDIHAGAAAPYAASPYPAAAPPAPQPTYVAPPPQAYPPQGYAQPPPQPQYAPQPQYPPQGYPQPQTMYPPAAPGYGYPPPPPPPQPGYGVPPQQALGYPGQPQPYGMPPPAPGYGPSGYPPQQAYGMPPSPFPM